MGKKSKVPPAPDLTPIASAMQKQADQSFQLQQQQFEWAKAQDLKNQSLNQTLVNDYLTRQGKLDTIADQARAREQQYLYPIQEQFAREAAKYSDPAYQRQEAARQAAEVSRQYNLQLGQLQDRLESYGMDPTQVRSAALNLSAGSAMAAARAGAANAGRQAAIDRGFNLQGAAANMFAGLPAQVFQGYSGAGQQGGAALSGALQTTGSGASTMGTPMQWGQLGQTGLNQWGSMLNDAYKNQIAAYKAQQDSSSGWGQILGMGLGFAGQAAMPGFRGLMGGAGWSKGFGYAEGGAVPDQGIPVPPEASPSRGAVTDDIPAQLNAGEFIVPKETVQWLGEKHFQKLIEKSKEEKAQATAKPQVLPVSDPRYPEAPMMPPQATALPVGTPRYTTLPFSPDEPAGERSRGMTLGIRGASGGLVPALPLG